MSDLGPILPALQALYDDERAAPIGGAEERERIRSRVLVTLGVAAGVAGSATAGGTAAGGTAAAGAAASTTGTASPVAAAGAASIAGKLVVLAVAFGALGSGVYSRASSSAAADEHRVVAPPEVAPVPDPVLAALLAPAPPVVITLVLLSSSVSAVIAAQPACAPVARVPRPRSPSVPAVIAPPPPPVIAPPDPPAPDERPALAEPETPPPTAAVESAGPAAPPQHVLLARAWGALERGDAKTALELVERDRASHPESTFTEEREALGIVALRRLHRDAEARDGAKAFAARYPDSIHRPLVEPALETTP